MKNNQLSIHSRLNALQTASRFAAGARRILAADGDINPLLAVLREVNETILARTLRFEIDSGPTVELEVAGRRVLLVGEISGVAAAPQDLVGATLDDSRQSAVVDLLTAFCSGAKGVTVVSAPLDRAGDGMSVGLPVGRLVEALRIDLNAPSTPHAEDFLQQFLGQMGNRLIAWMVRRGDGEDESGGFDEMIPPLQTFLDDELAALNVQLDQITLSSGDPVCTVLGSNLGEGHSLLCLRADGKVLVGVIAGDAAAPVLEAWNAARVKN